MVEDRLKKARVCFLIEDFYPMIHGASVQTIALSERLIAGGSQVMVVTRRLDRAHPSLETHRGISIYRVPPAVGVSRFGKYLMLLPALWALFKRRRDFDYLIVPDLKVLGLAGVAAALAFRKICILNAVSVGEMNGSYATVYEESPSRTKLFAARAFVAVRNRVLMRADTFLGISRTLTEEFRQCGVPERKISLIHLGIDTKRFRALDKSEKTEMGRKLRLPLGRRFIFTGRLIKGKGVEFLVPAFAGLAEEFDDIQLVLVGSGQGHTLSCEESLRDYIREKSLEGRVHFVGTVENVSDYLQASDYFVFPSQSEGLGLSLIEAIACELPAIATGIEGILDIIDDGVNGLFVDYGDIDGIRRTMRELLIDPEKSRRLACAGRETVVRNFNIESKAEEYLALFADLSGRRARRFGET